MDRPLLTIATSDPMYEDNCDDDQDLEESEDLLKLSISEGKA